MVPTYVLLMCLLLMPAGLLADPIIVTTWNYENAVDAGWAVLMGGRSAIDAVETGCKLCEDQQCRGTVGFGGSPDELGETTLDALLMDGTTFNVGAVAGLRRVKNAVSVARYVFDNTLHTLLVGDQATEFAKNLGFVEESLSTPNTTQEWNTWLNSNCQPNFWMNVVPDPTTSCGPYTPVRGAPGKKGTGEIFAGTPDNHDTIGMVAIDLQGNVAAGTSTNGLTFKVPGRVGDSPVPGAGAYADTSVGAASATGNGDYFLRMLPSFVAVEEMRRGASPAAAAETAIRRILDKFPDAYGGVVAINILGEYGAACIGYDSFPYTVRVTGTSVPMVLTVPCISTPAP
ncbi:hypothetical protein B566_EDAN004918 [Ephemera danica]|nr:hypothetical protein B566_EDAN004918 [Ephemera danica]